MNAKQAAKWIADRHLHWCDVIERQLGPIARRGSPSCILRAQAASWAGHYYPGSRKCVYPVAYAITEQLDYDSTITHECCHHYADDVWERSQPHGEIFYWLLNGVCRQPADRCHKFKVQRAKAIGQLLLTKGTDVWAPTNSHIVNAQYGEVQINETHTLQVAACAPSKK